MSAAEVVDRAKKFGLEISEKYVYTTRSLMKRPKKKVSKKMTAAQKKAMAKVAVGEVKKAVPRKTAALVQMPGKPETRREATNLLSQMDNVDQGALTDHLREVCFRLGLLQIKEIVREFEYRLDTGRMFPNADHDES
jgi:hypothetical protein